MKDLTINLRVRVPLDESMMKSAGWRCLWEEVDDIVEKFRGMGKVTAMSLDGMPERVVFIREPDTE